MIEKLLYFTSRQSTTEAELDRLLHLLLEPDRLERCGGIEEVHRSLTRPGGNIRTAVLVVTEERELLELYRLRGMLFDLRLFVLLPDHDEAAVALAHALRPRFIGFVNRDEGIVEEMLHKTIGRSFGKTHIKENLP